MKGLEHCLGAPAWPHTPRRVFTEALCCHLRESTRPLDNRRQVVPVSGSRADYYPTDRNSRKKKTHKLLCMLYFGPVHTKERSLTCTGNKRLPVCIELVR